MASTGKHLYEFASFRLDPAERRLLRDGQPVALTPKSFDVLVALVEGRGHLIEKGELLARIWPDQFVEEGILSFNVSELRKALGGAHEGQQYIETVRKKGFRFVAPVKEVDAGVSERAAPLPSHNRRGAVIAIGLVTVAIAAAAVIAYGVRPARRVTTERSPRTIAVLPFKPLTAGVSDEPLEMGICNALITRLAGLDELVVRPTSSVVSYDEMGQDPLSAGRELGVDALVEGYIQRSGERVRVTARLLRTADGKSLWSGQFNETFTDIFAVEDSISRRIAEALELNISKDDEWRVTKHPTDDIEAYELYQKGDYFLAKRSPGAVAKSIDYFRAATVKDPGYALAFAKLSSAYIVLGVRADMPPLVSYRHAKAAALRAVEIDPASADAQSALANVNTWYDWDWPEAERRFARALELNPNDASTIQQYAVYLLVVGRHPQAIEQIRRAHRLEPVSVSMNVQVARILIFASQYDAAAAECRNALEMDDTFGGARLMLGRAYAHKGLYTEALAELERARSLLPGSAEVEALRGWTYGAAGHTADARQVLDGLQRSSRQKYVSPYHLAMVEAGLGMNDAALASLEKAYEDREGRMTILKFAPEFAALRGDPRFKRLLERMKL